MIDRAERLKKELTDKWVVVSAGAPELKRFGQLTGKVKTVNMNCRALVEFDGPVDIGWYDIDTSFLTVVDGPKPKTPPKHPEAKAAAKPPAAAKPAAAGGGGSPLDKIRAAASGGTPAPTASGSSPLDKIRAAAKPAAAAAPAEGGPVSAGGSPADKIRAAAKSPKAATEPAAEPAPAPAAEQDPQQPAPPAAAPLTGSHLDRIRAMGAARKSD